MLSQLPHQHRSLLPQPPPPPPPPPPPLPPHARSDLSKCRARVNTARGADLALFPVFDQYLPVAPLAPTQFSHAVLPQSVRAHLNLHLRASWLARRTTFCCQEIRKALEPTCVLHVLELGQSWLTAAANLHLHLRLDSLYLRLPASRR
jgi:hypothetical protein